MKNKTIVIDRKKWLRGTGDGFLRKKSGKMCCLGFASHQISGCTFKSMVNKRMPLDIGIDNTGLDGTFCDFAAPINDDMTLSDKQRETQLKELAKEYGFIFKFVN